MSEKERISKSEATTPSLVGVPETNRSLIDETRLIAAQLAGTSESTEKDPNLIRYAAQYENMSPEHKGRMTWEQVESRLTANERHFLKLGSAMQEGGVLFGIDQEGNPLIADGGDEPLLQGLNYWDTYLLVYGPEEESDICQDIIVNGSIYEVPFGPTGYEMFKDVRGQGKHEEVIAFEMATGKPFVYCPECDTDGNTIEHQARYSWLDSGRDSNHELTRVAQIHFAPKRGTGFDRTYVRKNKEPNTMYAHQGVRRLLRVRDWDRN